MGYPQEGKLLHHPVGEEEDVDVQFPLPPAALPGAVPAKGGLDLLGPPQKFPGAPGVETRYHGVEKPGLILGAQGRCPVKRSPAELPQDLFPQPGGGFPQDTPGIALVRAEPQGAEGP